GPTKGDGYRYSTSGEISFNEAARGISDLGEIVYAILVADGIVKIGWTTDLYNRFRNLRTCDGAVKVLGFTFGGHAEEMEIHKALHAHVARGREYYHPAPEVMEVINGWRAAVGMDDIAA
ncbi:MAG: GIY-YIG nuclease family protein, partial [Chitinophagaceae bacterium]|nr:GIY-YIG nuclease family protein [Rubrivivax sp.]